MIIGLATPRVASTLDEGLDKVRQLLAEASARGAEIVCFPEAYLPGLRGQDFDVLPYDRDAQERVLRAVAQWSREYGLTTILGMERGLDTGPIYAIRKTAIDRKTAGALTEELAAIGAALMIDVLDRLELIEPRPQAEDGVTYAAKVEKSEARLDFNHDAAAVERQIRAFNPVPGAFFELRGERIKVLEAEIYSDAGSPGVVLDEQLTIGCASGAIRPQLVQRSGRGAMTSAELLRGFPITAGTALA